MRSGLWRMPSARATSPSISSKSRLKTRSCVVTSCRRDSNRRVALLAVQRELRSRVGQEAGVNGLQQLKDTLTTEANEFLDLIKDFGNKDLEDSWTSWTKEITGRGGNTFLGKVDEAIEAGLKVAGEFSPEAAELRDQYADIQTGLEVVKTAIDAGSFVTSPMATLRKKIEDLRGKVCRQHSNRDVASTLQ